MAKKKVYTILHNHRHGEDVYVFSTLKKLRKTLSNMLDTIAKEYGVSDEDRKTMDENNVHEFCGEREFITTQQSVMDEEG